MRHSWECDGCGASQETSQPITEQPLAPQCCGAAMRKLWFAPEIIGSRGRPDEKPLVLGRGRLTGMSAEQEIRQHSRIWRDRAARANDTRRARRGTRRRDDEIRVIASTPIQHFASRVKQFGSDYWTENPKEAAKREGIDFAS